MAQIEIKLNDDRCVTRLQGKNLLEELPAHASSAAWLQSMNYFYGSTFILDGRKKHWPKFGAVLAQP